MQLLERKFGTAAKREILPRKLKAVLLDLLQKLAIEGVKNEIVELDGSIYTKEWLDNFSEAERSAEKYRTIGELVFLKDDTQNTNYTQNDYEVIIGGLVVSKTHRLDLKQYPIDIYELDFDPEFIDANLAALQIFFGTEDRPILPTESLETVQKEHPDKVVVCDVLDSRYATQNFGNILIFNQLPDDLKEKIKSKFNAEEDGYFEIELDRADLESYFLIHDPHNNRTDRN